MAEEPPVNPSYPPAAPRDQDAPMDAPKGQGAPVDDTAAAETQERRPGSVQLWLMAGAVLAVVINLKTADWSPVPAAGFFRFQLAWFFITGLLFGVLPMYALYMIVTMVMNRKPRE